MTCVTFSEEEIATAWAARRKRQLRKLYSRNEYTRLLRLFKKRGMIVETQDRKEYCKKWRKAHPERIKAWGEHYGLLKKRRRHETKLKSYLNEASADQLKEALDKYSQI